MKVVAISIIIFIIISHCYSTRETVLKIIQPILIEEGLEESISTYVYFIGHPLASQVELTCAENYIQTESAVENRNIANVYKLKIEVIQNDYGLPIFGDTLRAKLILPEDFSHNKLQPSLSHDELISATIECALKNATIFESINYLELEIIGEPKYFKFSKVYIR
jgi:hypothetical protein